MTFKPYPKYKASGVEWLGDIPANWDVRKLTHAIDTIGSGTTPKTDTPEFYENGEISWVNTGDLNDSELYRCSKSVSKAALDAHTSLKIYPSGSVVIAMYGATIGKLALLRFPATVNQACCVFVGEKVVHSKFLFFWLFGFRDRIVSLATGGGQPNISQEIIRTLRLACPNLQEQAAIATFLDRETAKIDTLIAKQEAMINLLKEKRQAVISHAVTKGLDPNVPMKTSGVEWLGDVPRHWEVTRLGWVANEINDINHQMPVAVENGVPFLSAKDLLDSGVLNFTENIKQISEKDFEILSKKIRPRRNDIIYSRIGARLGKARLVETDIRFLVSYSCCVVRVNPVRALPIFICLLLDTDLVLTEAKARTNGIGVPDLGLDEIARFPVPLPPISEQEELVAFLNEQTVKFSNLIAKAEQAIALQKEHRTALIFAAVTGKIDVRSENELREAA